MQFPGFMLLLQEIHERVKRGVLSSSVKHAFQDPKLLLVHLFLHYRI